MKFWVLSILIRGNSFNHGMRGTTRKRIKLLMPFRILRARQFPCLKFRNRRRSRHRICPRHRSRSHLRVRSRRILSRRPARRRRQISRPRRLTQSKTGCEGQARTNGPGITSEYATVRK